MRRSAIVTQSTAAILTAILCTVLTGCGLQGTAPPAPSIIPAIAGDVHGGNQLVTGSTIQLYAVGTSGYGSPSTTLLPTITPVVTDSNGHFNITDAYKCPSASTQVYITATGGNPGLAPGTNNPALALMAALGNCGDLTSSTHLIINEVTTVGAVWALAQFMSGYANIGSTSTNTAGMQTAFFTSSQLVSPYTGVSIASAGTTIVPTPTLNSLANSLAGCVNSDGSTSAGTPCALLFTAATPSSGTAPTDTIGAALNIALHPTSHVADVFNIAAGNAPFQPTLPSTPPDWTVGILTYTSTARQGSTSSIVDAANNYWTFGFYTTGYASVSGPNPRFFSNTAFISYNPAFGLDGAIYSIPGGGGYNGYNTDGTSYTARNPGWGNVLPLSLAVAGNGNLWFLLSSGNLAKVTPTATPTMVLANLSLPTNSGAISPSAFDAAGNLFVLSAPANSVSKINTNPSTPTAAFLTGGGLANPIAMAVDHSNALWVANSGAAGISKFDSSGNPVTSTANYTGAGLISPSSIAVDGAGSIWLANYAAGGISSFDSSGAPLNPIALGTAYIGNSNAFSASIDGAGSVWVSVQPLKVDLTCFLCQNPNLQLVGLAAPVATPLALAVKNNQLGVRP